MQRQTLLACATLSALVIVSAACTRQRALEPVVQTVGSGVVERIQPETPERYSASIEPFAQVDLAFKSAGIVESIAQVLGADGRLRNVQAGDKVANDAELAQVRALDYQQRVEQAEAQLAQAQAQLAQAQASSSEAEIEYARAKNLFDTASLVKPQYDQAKGRYDANLAAVRAAQAGIAGAQAALSQARLSLSDTSLRAPFAGWISARNVDRGSLVSNTTVGFSMMDTHLVRAVFAVPDTSLGAVRLGQGQAVVLDALQRAVRGIVTSISPAADPKSRVFSIEVTLENPREEVRPGMIGSLTLGAPRDSVSRLAVPLSAVVRAPSDPSGFAVLCLEQRDGKTYAAARVIRIGQTFGNSIEVTQGLNKGQKIVAVGASLVRDGQEVRVLP